MQKFLLLLSLVPFFCAAQMKSLPETNTPLLVSIVSDTVNGKYKTIFFQYDQLKRVTAISLMLYEIKKTANGITESEKLIQNQHFQYHNNEQIPFARRIVNYDYEDIRMIRDRVGPTQQLQYFLFKNGKRIGDSTIYQEYEQLVKDAKFDDKKAQKRVASFVQTDSSVVRVLDLVFIGPKKYPSQNISNDSFVINKEHNIDFESSELEYKDRFYPRAYFTFNKYDQAVNPLHQLNIAALLSNEKITLSFGSDEMQEIGECIDGLGTEFNWHYLNQHNPLNLNFERGETESPFEDIIELSYSYNQDHQPTYCKTLVKKIFKKDDGRLAGTYKKSFTFRYKQ